MSVTIGVSVETGEIEACGGAASVTRRIVEATSERVKTCIKGAALLTRLMNVVLKVGATDFNF